MKRKPVVFTIIWGVLTSVSCVHAQDTTTKYPVYRFFNIPVGSAHFYTISEDEKDTVNDLYSSTFSLEGIAWYAFQNDVDSQEAKPVYRFLNLALGSVHFYTISEEEKNTVIANYSDIFEYEGVAYYAYDPGDHPGGVKPVYRFLNKTLGSSHFYTINEDEKNNVLENLSDTFQYEGIAFYAFDKSDPEYSDHSNLTWDEYPATCLNCHEDEYNEVLDTTHYQWVGVVEDMINQPDALQGKLTNAVNSYCVNILGNWPVCGSCHIGRGARPTSTNKENIDCLMCHNEEYATQRKRLADGSMGVDNPTDSMVQNISKPTRANCLQCHAKAGGGDGVKRGDLSLANISSTDPYFDVHMNAQGANIHCQECHIFQNHKTIGKGSDLRPTDDLSRGAELKCTSCHGSNPHGSSYSSTSETEDPSNIYILDRHANGHIACQTCHIPTYAKIATEVSRDWTHHHDGSPADGVSGPGHPHTDKAANLTPEYLWWNRLSDNYLLGDDAEQTYDIDKETYPTSRPIGSFMDGKIYPFKYKTAYQPIARGGNCNNQLIALDTFVYLKDTGDVNQAIANGLANMNCTGATVEWINSDTYQMINHGVTPKSDALQCAACHDNSGETPSGYGSLDFAKLGYHTWPAMVKSCSLCHDPESVNWQSMHEKHAEEMGTYCVACHTSEPTGLVEPATSDGLCNNCHNPMSYSSLQDLHEEHVETEGGGMTTICTDCHTF